MKLNPGLAFVLGDGEQRELIVMSQVRRQTVAVDVGEPFPFGGVGVASSGVFALKMLELAVNVVSIAWKERKLLVLNGEIVRFLQRSLIYLNINFCILAFLAIISSI